METTTERIRKIRAEMARCHCTLEGALTDRQRELLAAERALLAEHDAAHAAFRHPPIETFLGLR